MTLEEVLQYPEDHESLELKRKIDSITQYCSKPYFKEALKKLAIANLESANIICEYIIASKPFGKVTKQDILNYLNYLRRPLSEDPTHR